MSYLLKSCQNEKDQMFVGMLQKSYIIKFWEVFKRQLAEFFFSTEALKKITPKVVCPSCFGRALVSLLESFCGLTIPLESEISVTIRSSASKYWSTIWPRLSPKSGLNYVESVPKKFRPIPARIGLGLCWGPCGCPYWPLIITTEKWCFFDFGPTSLP